MSQIVKSEGWGSEEDIDLQDAIQSYQYNQQPVAQPTDDNLPLSYWEDFGDYIDDLPSVQPS